MKPERTATADTAGFTLIEMMVVLLILALTATFVTLTIDTTQRQDEHEVERLRLVLEAAAERAQVQGEPMRIELLAQGYRFSHFDVQGNWTPVIDDPRFADRNLSSELVWRGLEINGETGASALVFGTNMPAFVLRIGTPAGVVALQSLPTGVVHRVANPPAVLHPGAAMS